MRCKSQLPALKPTRYAMRSLVTHSTPPMWRSLPYSQLPMTLRSDTRSTASSVMLPFGMVTARCLPSGDSDTSLNSAWRKTADSLLRVQASVGSLPGRLSADWKGTVDWVCVTGVAQIAACWLILFEKTSDSRYREAAFRANRFVRSTLRLDASEDVRGGVKGSFPVDGDYGKYQYLNWACKFMIDANRMELISADRDLL